MSNMDHSSLSSRERQLIEFAANDLTDHEMAEKLGISIATVATYWSRIRAKYGGHSRAGLVAKAMEEHYAETLQEIRDVAVKLSAPLSASLGVDGERASLCEAVVESASEAIVVADSEGRIRYLNLAAQDLFGYPRGEAEGENLALLLPQHTKEVHDRDLARRRSEPEHRPAETARSIAQHRSGKEFPVCARLVFAESRMGPILVCFIEPAQRTASAERRPHPSA